MALVHGDQRQTQHLEDFDYLYSSSFPGIRVQDSLLPEGEPAVLPAEGTVYVELFDQGSGDVLYFGQPIPQEVDLRVGLFRDRELVMWYDREIYEYSLNGDPARGTRWVRPEEVALEVGHTYCEAAVYTDEYGRQQVYTDSGWLYSGGGMLTTNGAMEASRDPADWSF